MTDDATAVARIQRAQSGDLCAVEEIVREYRPRILRFALARLADAHAAEDATQEACLGLIRALPTFDTRSQFTSFVFAIAHHKIVDVIRAGVRSPQPVDITGLDDRQSPDDGPEELAVIADQVRALVAPMSVLTERDRSILLLRVIAGMSSDEVAETLGMSPGSVRVAQHRALNLLRTQLGGDGVS